MTDKRATTGMYYVKAKIKKYEVKMLSTGFFKYSERFNKKNMAKCHKCRNKFFVGEIITLVVTNHGNVLWCECCTKDVISKHPEIKVIHRKK